ncbi:histidine kinase [Clostridium botulinum]|uniref:histidine kinase n=2 Tax=Clostridium botulinum TaxID=1491 RepID=A0A9Q1V0H0_CLOBO|nr:ATP-binding protein [Clostridium botulinum]AEB76640.1 sensory transduction histidine kinase [Clostridium botulinum BKT015925]KEI03047.1 histidine kinase [Clostridium botulinum C/D str. Sp77]KOA79337.1 histidine kinase [Clostridium botulinum]KOA85553.1 histidine kinase [Clostridium botulinum]KOA88846.1 histidine kinase [Clostridium botulinum]
MLYYKKTDEITLEEVLCNKKICLKDFLEISLKIVDAIMDIHKKNIVYKYLNPNNIVIDKNKDIRLKKSEFMCRDINYNLNYMSPEQIGRIEKEVDFRTDYYSLGVILYKMLTQKLPLEGDNEVEVTYSHIAKTPIPPNKINNQISIVISNIVMKLLDKDPDERYKSVYGIKMDLERCNNSFLNNGFIYNFALASKDISDKLKFTEKIYGREKEIKKIMDKYHECCNGSLEVVFISGDGGLGKKVVADEVSKRIIKEGGMFAASKCKKYNNGAPYEPLIKCGRTLMNKMLMESEDEIKKIKKKILDAVGNNGQIITKFIPEVEFLIGKQPPLQDIGCIESTNRFNTVFGRSIQAILSREKTIAILLEDIQWLDEGSLNIIKKLILRKENKYLFIIAIVKEEEVKNKDFVYELMNNNSYNDINITNIHLNSLSEDDIGNLICDTLSCNREDAKELIKNINFRTGGNPLFVRNSIESMYSKRILRFDYRNNKWVWDIKAVRNMKIENSVFGIIMGKISSLPKKTKNILKIASCIGVEFALKSISDITNVPIEEIYMGILPAIDEGVILFNENQINKYNNKKITYKFSHVQIHIQIYDNIDKEQKSRYHLALGRSFYKKFLKSNSESQIFRVVNQLNKGKQLINNDEEIYNLIKLNLIAGLKDKQSGVYQLAIEYFRVAYSLLPHNSWYVDYNLAYNVSIELSECEFMNKNFEKAEEIFSIILKNIKTPWEVIKIYNMKVCIHTYFGQIEKAIETGINGLKILGIYINKKPNTLKIYSEGLKLGLKEKRIISKITSKFKKKEDKVIEELKKLFFNISIAAIMYNKELFRLVTLKEMQISNIGNDTKYGNCTYMNYGIFKMYSLKQYDKSFEFGYDDLIRCNNKIDAITFSKSYCLFANLIVLWSNDYEVTLKHLYRCYDVCMDGGQLLCATITTNNILLVSLMKGENLNVINDKISKYMEASQKISFIDIKEEMLFNKTIVDILRGEKKDEFVFKFEKNITKFIPLGRNIYRILINYMSGKYEDSIKFMTEAEKEATILEGRYISMLYNFFNCLTLIKLYEFCDETKKFLYMKKIKKHVRYIKKRVRNNYYNFLSYYILLQAEIYRLNDKGYKAERLYDEAIKVATEKNMINNIALISEIAGYYYETKGNTTVSKLYLIQAYTFYKKWGCKFKTEAFQQKYPMIFGYNIQNGVQEEVAIDGINKKLYIDDIFECSLQINRNKYEFMEIIKAFQSISGEILLENLLEELMKNLIGSIGAERGCLILNKNNKLFVQVEGNIDKFYSMVDNPIGIENYREISKLLVNYVARTKQSVVLNNGKNESVVFDDSYISDNKIKSILCVPIITKGKFIGIIYLENKFSANIFSKKRLSIVELIASQAAISIENAYMYKEINELNGQLKKTVDERTRLLNESIRYEEMRTEFFANISHELRTPLNVIFGGYQMLKLMLESENLQSKPKIDKYMGTMKQNCYRLVRLINNLIDITKIDSGFFEVNLINVDIINTIESITLSVAQYIESKGINLVFDTFVEEKIIACDVDKIERIILNLLSNAIKFTNPGGNIAVTMYEEKNNIVISVKDDGIGIPDEKQSIIFDRFIQVDKSLSRNREGSGIGLSLVKSIVELHKGKIYLKSKLGEGSEFIIKLPCSTLEIQDKNAEMYSNANSNKIEKIMIEFSDIYS